MEIEEMKRWGLLLDVLSEIADVERQLVVQGSQPATFIPDELLDRWYSTFSGGKGLSTIGVSEAMLMILLDFDYHVSSLMDVVPTDARDKESYIRNDITWRSICDLADWTLERIVEQTTPEPPEFCQN